MTIKVGMISFAHLHAFSYAECFKSLSNEVELVGIFDDNEERGKAAAKQYDVKFHKNCEKMLDKDLDAVVICTENSKHKQYTLMAAEAGKHILCEKPISTNLADSQEMIDGCQKHNVQLMIAFPCRSSAPLLRARELVQEGRLGNILALKGTNRGTMPGDWFIQKEFSGGGAVIDHTVHVVDVWRWMLNQEVTSVYAEFDNLFYPEIKIEDAGLLSLQFESGIIASLDTSWSRPNNSFPTWGDVTLEIVGDKGSLYVDAFRQHIDLYNNDAVKAQWMSWTDDINLHMVHSFVRMVAEVAPSPITGFDGLKAMEVALGAYRSAEIGAPVALPLEGVN